MNQHPHRPYSRRRSASRAAIPAVALALCVGLALTACAVDEGVVPALAGSSTELGVAGDPRTPENGYLEFGETLSPFDEHLPAISRLDPDLLAAVQAATTAATADGFVMVITSGWRSAELQQALLDAAVTKYGSLDEARKWVNTPERSTHVTGNAVDIGYTDANSWLSQHGARYGLCQTYANEMWHFELATEPGGVCPPQLPDAVG